MPAVHQGDWTFAGGAEMNEPPSNAEPGSTGEPQNLRFPPSLPMADSFSNVHECSYLDGQLANLPLKLPARLLTPDEFDQVMAGGIRRSGVFLYHTSCPHCTACEPTRVNVAKFEWRSSFKRVLKRGDQQLSVVVNPPSMDEQRLRLFNLHRTQRGLGKTDDGYRSEDYQSFLVDTCLTQSVELSFWKGADLVAVSIVDCGRISLSAVYTFFDPQHSALSLGTYSVLKQIEFARNSGRQYAYLGLYVAQNQHLNYKARFQPQERLIDGKWVEFA